MATFPQTSIAVAPRESDWGITEERIRAKVDELVRAYHPLRIIAFGSWARGEARPDSDLDLAVILDETSRAVSEWPVTSPIEMSVDVLVEKKERHQLWAFAIASVHHDIATQGVVLYDRENGRGPTPFYVTPNQEDLLSIKSESLAALMKIAGRDEKSLNVDANDVETRAYHGQQALEKLMKVWLAAADVVPPRTHILKDLAAELHKNGLMLPTLPVNLEAVTEYATKWRYFPIPDSDKLDLEPLQQAVRLLREHVTQELATRNIQIKQP
jgi:predicted nucleotidyltransferase/HEPN domain-containing protein